MQGFGYMCDESTKKIRVTVGCCEQKKLLYQSRRNDMWLTDEATDRNHQNLNFPRESLAYEHKNHKPSNFGNSLLMR